MFLCFNQDDLNKSKFTIQSHIREMDVEELRLAYDFYSLYSEICFIQPIIKLINDNYYQQTGQHLI
jgi:hypothetical protein